MLLAISTIIANVLYLVVPKFISSGIDSYVAQSLLSRSFYGWFIAVSFGIFLLTYFQGVFQTYVAEKAAYDIRNQLADKISRMSYKQLEEETHSKLLTNFTSDIEAVKQFFSFAVAIAISSVVVIIGAAWLLISINWKLALSVLAILPFIGILFVVVFSKIGPLFKKIQEIMDRFNTIISESVIGSAIVRVLNSGDLEYEKFKKENNLAKENGMTILKYFSLLIPIIGVIANLAALIILVLGGKYVILGSMSLGDFTAFNSYVFILIFPIIMLGFISSTISRAQESYVRIQNVFDIKEEELNKTLLLQFNTSKNEDKNFHLAAGVIGGVRVGSKLVQKFDVFGKESKNKSKGVYNLNSFQAIATVRMGYNDIGLFANYNLLPLFEKGKAEEVFPLTIGVSMHF